MHKMDPELKAKWLEALRDEENKQIRGAFASDSGYCCLGLLHRIETNSNWRSKDFSKFDGYFSSERNGTKQCGLSEEEDILIDMNDKQEKTFLEIADWVELYL